MTREEAIDHGKEQLLIFGGEHREFIEIAIKALEQESCEDAISRQAVLNLTKELRFNSVKGMEDYCYRCIDPNEVEELPPVTPKARWISCNERLPKAGEYVGDVCKYYLIQDEYGDMHVAHLSKVGWIPMDSLKAIGNEIVAWQELPQPYKAESEEA